MDKSLKMICAAHLSEVKCDLKQKYAQLLTPFLPQFFMSILFGVKDVKSI